jgi:hypothetical protein
VTPADFELQVVQYGEGGQYKLHYDAELSTGNVASGMARSAVASPSFCKEYEPPCIRTNISSAILYRVQTATQCAYGIHFTAHG